jgi:hypothetical protein
MRLPLFDDDPAKFTLALGQTTLYPRGKKADLMRGRIAVQLPSSRDRAAQVVTDRGIGLGRYF